LVIIGNCHFPRLPNKINASAARPVSAWENEYLTLSSFIKKEAD